MHMGIQRRRVGEADGKEPFLLDSAGACRGIKERRKKMSEKKIPYKIYLEESEMPRQSSILYIYSNVNTDNTKAITTHERQSLPLYI